MKIIFRGFAVSFWLLLTLVCLRGQTTSSPPNKPSNAWTTTAHRIANAINVDGSLDEPEWANASTIGEILQREPKPGEPSSERTEVKLLYDKQNLYVGVLCYDSQPTQIIGTQMARDADLSVDDRIEILLDTFHDKRNAFYFSTNPLGALVDALIIENGQLNRDWNAIWYVRTQKFAGGWSAEFAIPFKSLGFHKGQQIWGFNVSRTIKRKFEEDRWASPRLDIKFPQVSEAGDIGNFTDIEQGIGLDARPFISGKALQRQGAKTDFTGKVGGDIFYNLTPSLKLTATLNTDFAETEVDNRQINLTRFPLFFPEKRAFFLENAGVFNFSSTGSELLPFFSRRIGLLAGQEVPILFGSKLTGKVERFDIGVLTARTRETNFVEAENFFVGRVKRNLFKQSYLGGIYTEGDPERPTSSRTLGADLRLSTSKFLDRNQNFGIDLFALKSFTQGVGGDNGSYGISLSYPNDLFDILVELRQVERNFRPALGFVQRRDVRKLNISAEYNPRPKNFLNVRQMFHEFRFLRFTRLDKGRTENWRLFTAPINWALNSGEHLEFNWAPQFERLFEPFEIAEGVILPVGDYHFTRWRAEVFTASRRAWQVNATWWFGSYWSGHADEVNISLQYKFAPHFQAGLDTRQTFARLKEGSFVARVFSLRANYSLSPYLTFFNLVEFDNQSKNLGWQSRVRWILKPGNEFFFVFNQGWLQDEQRGFHFRSTSRQVAGKLQYTFRF